MMRIVGGRLRHRLLKFPPDPATRPTKDRIREALFSALGAEVVDRTVLDLFAGSGALGLEAMSRGAKEVTFVDKNREAIRVIQENLTTLKVEGTVLHTDDQTALQAFISEGKTFNLVFLDPPYARQVCEDLIRQLIETNILTSNGIIVVETNYELEIDEAQFSKIRSYKYGITYIHICRR